MLSPSRTLLMTALLTASGSAYAVTETPLFSYLPSPDQQFSRFVAENLDLSSFRNSLNQRRHFTQKYFSQLKVYPTKIEPGLIEFDQPEWFYSLKIYERKDYNNDAVEDVAVCFTDRAKNGSYEVRQPLLLSRYGDHMPLIALSYAPDLPDCTEKKD